MSPFIADQIDTPKAPPPHPDAAILAAYLHWQKVDAAAWRSRDIANELRRAGDAEIGIAHARPAAVRRFAEVLEREILAMPAHSIVGIAIKLRLAGFLMDDETDDQEDPYQDAMTPLIQEAQALADLPEVDFGPEADASLDAMIVEISRFDPLAQRILEFKFDDDDSFEQNVAKGRRLERLVDRLAERRGGADLARDKLRVLLPRFKMWLLPGENPDEHRDFRLLKSALRDLEVGI